MMYQYNKQTGQILNIHTVMDALFKYEDEGDTKWYDSRRDFDYMSEEDRMQFGKALDAYTGKRHFVTTSRGPIEIPSIGDRISKGFNGDYYPDGVIASITPSGKTIVSSEGTTYNWSRKRGNWYSHRTFGLVMGHVSRWNPEF